MESMLLLVLIAVPAILGLVFLFVRSKLKYLVETISVIFAAYLVFLTLSIWGKPLSLSYPWAGFGMNFQLRYYAFSQFIAAAIASFTFLIVLFSIKFMESHPKANLFYGLLFISEAMALGAVLANNLVVMLFFWEGLLITLYSLISIGNPGAYRSAVKALVIVGASDLCLMLGIGIVGVQAKTLVMNYIQLDTSGINGAAFVLMMIGAMGKAGAIPFHTWIPDAAGEAPLPFMAYFPAAMEKLLGIYLTARIALDFFTMTTGMKLFLMTIGALTIIIAVMMALIQKEFKRLLSYHAVSQVGYMILGIGTGTPIGAMGGLFHMINHAIYKCCLFLTSGAVEKETGTTELKKLGGLRKQMPVTFVCFLIAAAAISGVPPFNGFVSKELILEAALDSGYIIFFAAGAIGAVLTAASFLKLGHAVFFGKTSAENKGVHETHWTGLIPMSLLALGCLIFGIWYRFPLNDLIKPALIESLMEQLTKVHFSYNLGILFWLTVIILNIAIFNHLLGVKLSGSGLGASEHIHHAPGLSKIYHLAEKKIFDPYCQGKTYFPYLAQGLFKIDRAIDWFYQKAVPLATGWIVSIRNAHDGLFSNYLAWSLGGLTLITVYIFWIAR